MSKDSFGLRLAQIGLRGRLVFSFTVVLLLVTSALTTVMLVDRI